jgi:hypothetical protein
MKMVVVTNLIKEVQEVVARATLGMMEMKHELKNWVELHYLTT